MKRPMFPVIMLVLLIVVLTNLFAQQPDCRYANYDGSFTFMEQNTKGRNFRMCQNRFTAYKKEIGQDTLLYRINKKNLLQFWNYSDYLFKDEFKLPYMSWKDIESRRGQIENKTGFQDF